MAKTDYSAPWADKLPTGERIEYGPSPTTYARQMAEFHDWAWKPGDKIPSKLARSAVGYVLRAHMRPDGEHLRTDVPRRELEIYVLIYEHGRSVRWVARHLKISRSSVRTYVTRLAQRREMQCDEDQGENE